MSNKPYKSAVLGGLNVEKNNFNEHEQETNTTSAHEDNEYTEPTTNVHEEHEQEMDLIDEAEDKLDKLLNPRKAEKEKKPEKIPVAAYLEPKVYDNLRDLEEKHKKGFRTTFINEILKKEMVARGLWKENVKPHHKKRIK